MTIGGRPPRARRRLRRALAATAALAVLAALFHVPLLTGAAAPLIADEPVQTADFVLIFGGDRAFDRAAALVRQRRAAGVLAIGSYPDRLVRLGVVPSNETIARRELVRRGLADGQIRIIPAAARHEWQRARILRSWLGRHPVRLVVLCDRFDSQAQRDVLASVLGKPALERISIQALPDRRYSEKDWWRSHTGVKAFFNSYFNLVYGRVAGENGLEGAEWDPDEYEKALKQESVE